MPRRRIPGFRASSINPANPEIHRTTTAVEIWQDTDGAVDIVVGGIGTGGTITGVGQVLKQLKPALKVIAVEPTESPILSGGNVWPAQDPGYRRELHPGRARTAIYDEIVHVSSEEAMAPLAS